MVSALEDAGRIVRVRLILPDGAGIAARITGESAELLGLAEGMTAIALAGGELQLVGFAPSGSGLRVRQRVTARVDEAAVVVALPG